MSRSAQTSKINKIILPIFLAAALIGGGLGLRYQLQQNSRLSKSKLASQTAPTTQVSYRGLEGKTALDLLKVHAKVTTKSSSLGDYVVAINGNDGGGKKYWLFYVNDKLADVGAGQYATHNNDTVVWKLQ